MKCDQFPDGGELMVVHVEAHSTKDQIQDMTWNKKSRFEQ